jgi:glyoxylase-like metal-dependent hydrolase (beta-lactamase superfamily II)
VAPNFHWKANLKKPVQYVLDERQAVPEEGQTWTNLYELSENHGVIIKKLHPLLYELRMVPSFAIGQRALLVITPYGNILWDCIALINVPTIEFINSKGGLIAIAVSHPHYYTTMNEWAEIFDCPVYIHQDDNEWIFNRGRQIRLWEGEELILEEEIKLLRIGGHFTGASVLQVSFLSKGGALLCGDTFFVSPSKKHILVMYSYPNRIPLSVHEVQSIKNRMASIQFDTLYGFHESQNILTNAKNLLMDSLGKYT